PRSVARSVSERGRPPGAVQADRPVRRLEGPARLEPGAPHGRGGAGRSHGSERLPASPGVPARRFAGPGRQAAGDVWTGRNPPGRLGKDPGDAPSPLPRAAADPGDAGSSRLLGADLPGGEEGAERPVPETPLARRPLERPPDRPRPPADLEASFLSVFFI